MTRPTARQPSRAGGHGPGPDTATTDDHPPPGTAGEQLAHELAQRLAPFDQLAKAAGIGRPFTTQALERLPTADIVDNIDPDTARAIVTALWPAGVTPTWWQTHLGRAVAGQLATSTPATETVPIAQAARMLGVTHARIIQLTDTGHLTRTTDGISLADVYERVANPGKPGRPGWRL